MNYQSSLPVFLFLLKNATIFCFEKQETIARCINTIIATISAFIVVFCSTESKADVISNLSDNSIGKYILSHRLISTEKILSIKINDLIKNMPSEYKYNNLKSNINFICHQYDDSNASCVQIFYERNDAANYPQASHITIYILQIFYKSNNKGRYIISHSTLDSRSDIK